jgi:hypothetical protein
LHQEVIVQLDRLNKAATLKDAKSPIKPESDAQQPNNQTQGQQQPPADKKYQRALTFEGNPSSKR